MDLFRELVVFLLARLDDEERIAMAATGFYWAEPSNRPENWRWECAEDDTPIDVNLAIARGQDILEHDGHWSVGLRSTETYSFRYVVGAIEHLILGAEEVRPQDARHIAYHDPARTMRRVRAHRQIIALHKTDIDPTDTWYGSNARCEECGTYVVLTGPCKALRILAIIYSDHPDYQREWAL